MILIFDKDGKYVNETRTNNEAAELTGNLAGNVSQITNGFYGNMTAKGFYFIKYDIKGSELEKQNYIDRIEWILGIMIICWKQDTLQNRIDKIITLL